MQGLGVGCSEGALSPHLAFVEGFRVETKTAAAKSACFMEYI